MIVMTIKRRFKGKFADVWMIIAYDANGPSIDLYKNETAKKLIGTKLHIPSLANQIRFGTTCRLYGNLPEIKPDPKIDRSCLMAFQIERRVKKAVQPQLLWLCAESTKQMFAIMKVRRCLENYNNMRYLDPCLWLDNNGASSTASKHRSE